ncbi:hypothetical protein ScPMuIL_014392 [Solemya velum]
MKLRRGRWLGHVLRMNTARHPYTALRWIPPGKRRRGRRRDPWGWRIEADILEMGKTWSEMRNMGQDRESWSRLIGALCSINEEDKYAT